MLTCDGQIPMNRSRTILSHRVGRNSAEHYMWGEHCDGWYLLKDTKLTVIEEQMPAGAAEIRHYHDHTQQFFFMLFGEAVIEVDDQEVRLTAGEGLHVAPGQRHRIKNTSPHLIRFLVISEPPSHGDRVDIADNS